MFYPKCPHCDGKVTSTEPNMHVPKHAFAQWLQQQAAANHPHPLLKMAATIGMAGYEVYKRVPGGGEKRCENGHIFR